MRVHSVADFFEPGDEWMLPRDDRSECARAQRQGTRACGFGLNVGDGYLMLVRVGRLLPLGR